MRFRDLFKKYTPALHHTHVKSSVTHGDLVSAHTRIASYVPPTPLTFSPSISELIGHEIYLKWENKHRTGSFKERGALNFLLLLSDTERKNGVCAASAGNHALALSYYAAKLSIPCHLVMPIHAPLVKVASARKTGAEIILYGSTFNEAYEHAKNLAKANDYLFVPAFDHPSIIAGQGTAGLEILHQLDDFDSVVVPVGGGGLISGIALAIKDRKPTCFILGVQSEWAIAARTKETTHHALSSPTIADGIAVKTIGSSNAPLIDLHVNSLVTVHENNIARAIIDLLERERTVVEGAGAAALAALLEKKLPSGLKKTVVVVSGSNIDMNLLSRLIDRDTADSGRLIKLVVSIPDAPGSLHEATGVIAGTGANILQVTHDRSFSNLPGNVDVSFLLEVKDAQHKESVLTIIQSFGLEVRTG